MLEVHTDKLHVHFIDYGNKETVQVRTAVRADSEFFSIPPLAERFVIAGFFPANGVSWTTAEYDLLHKKLLNAEFQVEVIGDSVTGFPPLIHLLNVDFVSLSVLPPLISRWPSVQAAQQFALAKRYTVFVTHYESVLNFYVQDSCEQTTLDRFHAALANSVEDGKSRCLEPKQCWPGILCVARYKGSDQFYRAVVREVDWQGLYGVTFIDYGDSATVSINDLWPINEQFLKLPIQALRCCVTGQSAHVDSDKIRSAVAVGCPVDICISAVSSVHRLVEIELNRAAAGHQVMPLLCPVRNNALPVISRYMESSLAEGEWHNVCVSSVETDGSFYCQLLANAVKLNTLMVELSSVQLLPLNGAVVDGMACVVRSPADGCVYRAHVCILLSGLRFVFCVTSCTHYRLVLHRHSSQI